MDDDEDNEEDQETDEEWEKVESQSPDLPYDFDEKVEKNTKGIDKLDEKIAQMEANFDKKLDDLQEKVSKTLALITRKLK